MHPAEAPKSVKKLVRCFVSGYFRFEGVLRRNEEVSSASTAPSVVGFILESNFESEDFCRFQQGKFEKIIVGFNQGNFQYSLLAFLFVGLTDTLPFG